MISNEESKLVDPKTTKTTLNQTEKKNKKSQPIDRHPSHKTMLNHGKECCLFSAIARSATVERLMCTDCMQMSDGAKGGKLDPAEVCSALFCPQEEQKLS
jgi:hypothetical protein